MNAVSATAEVPAQTAQPETRRAETQPQSWGRYPRAAHRHVFHANWRDQLPAILRDAEAGSLLPYGVGRSYGDSCLNDGRDLVVCSGLNRILDADWQSGRVRVESGVTLADLLPVIVPRGWFLPVTPGTKFVTIGGAIANDVHGKNHHRAGTFGRHVTQLQLQRSDAGAVRCSKEHEPELFAATIGGMGLTGVIEWAEVQLKAVPSNAIDVETLPFRGLEDFASISKESDSKFEYTVAWLDCLSGRRTRGLFFRGNHSSTGVTQPGSHTITVPMDCPDFVLSTATISLFNQAYYVAKLLAARRATVHYDPFFYPLDAVLEWNRVYGKRGLVQYQCVVPHSEARALEEMIDRIGHSGHGCFLAVLKAFGEASSPGLLSFPRPGLTLALDLPVRGEPTLRLLNDLDAILAEAGGALYPAKDARMSAATFAAGFPRWRELSEFLDPKCSSSFWRRVTGEACRT
jgi:FAD/FMN-containing dehydrogenase